MILISPNDSRHQIDKGLTLLASHIKKAFLHIFTLNVLYTKHHCHNLKLNKILETFIAIVMIYFLNMLSYTTGC